MHLGTRKIRSAGRSSGSIEITLPTDLRAFEGVACHVIVRDGARPEIVLQPDLSSLHALFRSLWQNLRLGFEAVGEIGDFSLGDYNLTLLRPRQWQSRPPLVYADALLVSRWHGGARDEAPEALCRLLAFLAMGAAARLDLTESLIPAFGDAITYLMTGSSPNLGTDFERGMAHRMLWGKDSAQPLGSPFERCVWERAQSALNRVYEKFRAWERDPDAYEKAREKWYRALTLEMSASIENQT